MQQRQNTIAKIYVDGLLYTEIDLSTAPDAHIELTNSSGNINTIEIKSNDLRMYSADCKNQLCIHQGWAKSSAVPIVCLPNNIVIVLTGNNNKEVDSLDAITY